MSNIHRILYLVTSSGWGGAERYVSILAREAMTLGEVHVIAGHGNETLFAHLPQEAFVTRSSYLRRHMSPLADIRAALELRKYIQTNSITFIHANSTKAGLIASLAVIGLRVKPHIIYTAHGWAFLETDRSPLFRALTYQSERFASRFRSATIVLSEMERRVALEKGLADDAHLHLIPLGLSTHDITFLSRENAREKLLKKDVSSFVFGTIANAYPPKALPLLVSAFDRIAENRPDTKLVIIGDGPSMPALKNRVRESRFKERIILAGYLPDASSYLKAFDVFVLSSTKEGMPWSVLEASLAELPLITTKVGALPEMIRDEETGLLVESGDVKALTHAMARVYDDETLRHKLKDGSPRIAKSRPEELMIQKTLKVY